MWHARRICSWRKLARPGSGHSHLLPGSSDEGIALASDEPPLVYKPHVRAAAGVHDRGLGLGDGPAAHEGLYESQGPPS